MLHYRGKLRFALVFCVITTMMLGLSACSSLEYVDNNDLKRLYSTNDSLKKEEWKGGGKQFGAFHLNEPDGSAEKRLFLLKRNKSRFMAETMVHQDASSAVKKGLSPERTYVSFGADHKKRYLGFQLRMEY